MYFWPLCPPNTTLSDILRAQGEPTRVVFDPGEARPAQPDLDRTSVFLRKTMVLGHELLVFLKEN